MIKKRRGISRKGKRVFILDTNVLVHDPAAFFRFHEHDVHIPIAVIEELDSLKRGASDVARHARQASRYLDDLLVEFQVRGKGSLTDGIDLSKYCPDAASDLKPTGKLVIQSWDLAKGAKGGDNGVLAYAEWLRKSAGQATEPSNITLISKDINLRIKAATIGFSAEDYLYDSVDEKEVPTENGYVRLPEDFWDRCGTNVNASHEDGFTVYRVRCDLVKEWHVNQFLEAPGRGGEPLHLIVTYIDGDEAALTETVNYRHKEIWGINARNDEQNYALNLLMDPDIDFVVLTGAAGTGKTLLALAAALEQTSAGANSLFEEIIMTRVTIPLGEDIGFLPGTEEEKMTPWMGALKDNLEVLGAGAFKDKYERETTMEVMQKKIAIRSINFMRGRTFFKRFVIVDEAQNLTPKQMKALLTRAGPGTKMVLLGDLEQIDTPYLDARSSGLAYVIQRMKGWEFGGHVALRRGERSRLAQFAATAL